MEEKPTLTLFQKLCAEMVDKPTWASKLLYGTSDEVEEELRSFLKGSGVNPVKAADAFIAARDQSDIGALDLLRDTLDEKPMVHVPI